MLLYLALSLLLLVFVAPLVWAASGSFKPRGDIFAYTQAARNDPENPHKPVRARFLSPKAEAAQAFAQKKAEAALRMKTPLQLRWEQEQARKLQAQKETPAVDTETLLAALGQHMQANGVKKNGKRRAASQAAELD